MARRKKATPVVAAPEPKQNDMSNLDFSIPMPHTDAWENPSTWVGTENDKQQHLHFQRPKIAITFNWQLLSSMFHYDVLARKIVETWPTQMYKRGWKFTIKGKETDVKLHDKVQKDFDRLNCKYNLFQAEIWGRLFGGSLLLIGARDGTTDLSQPLREDKIRSVDYINMVDRRYITTQRYYADYQKPNYGQPEVYRIFRTISAGGTQQEVGSGAMRESEGKSFLDVHESRIIRFEGDYTDVIERQILAGWSHSVLQAPYEEMKRFQQTFQGASHLLTDASQAVYRLKGLIQQLGSKEGRKLLQTRMAMVNMARSVARALLLDADGEEFTRVQTSFTAVPELLDRFMCMLSMATGIPVTILMGRSAAGMNATGDSDFRAFYGEVAAKQKNTLEPKLQRLYQILSMAHNGPSGGRELDFEFEFIPLWDPSDEERAKANLDQAQADQIYLQNRVLTPEEMAHVRFKTPGFNADTVINLQDRKKSMEDGVPHNPYPNAEIGEPNTPATGSSTGVVPTPVGKDPMSRE
jgi:uncharacterized protein